MANILEQTKESYVGAIVDLIHIDLTPIGSPTQFYLTPSSHTPITFNGNVYNPFPLSLTGQSRDSNSAPGRVVMKVDNTSQMLAAAVISYGDMVGGHVTYTRTFDNFLDGKADGGTNQSFPVQRYIILQKSMFNQSAIEFVLGSSLDRPGLMLPRRQTLKTPGIRGSLFCPGMTRQR